MQAMGLVNDHIAACVVRAKAEQARRKFRKPRPRADLEQVLFVSPPKSDVSGFGANGHRSPDFRDRT